MGKRFFEDDENAVVVVKAKQAKTGDKNTAAKKNVSPAPSDAKNGAGKKDKN